MCYNINRIVENGLADLGPWTAVANSGKSEYMLAGIRRYLDERRKTRKVMDRAIDCFEKTKGQKAHRGQCIIIYSDGDKSVVRVCYGTGKPLRRAFYEVRADGGILGITFHQAKAYGERRWR